MEIKSNGDNPEEFGFNPDYKKIKYFLENKLYITDNIYSNWKDIFKEFYAKKDKMKEDKNINWIYKMNLDAINTRYKRIDKRIIRFLKRKMGRNKV